MISFIISAIKIIFLLGLLITIHELGHFLVAKLCKIKVKEFAIGFGPTIWKKQGKETKYALRLIPLGGFVNMLGEEERSEEEGSFSKAPIPKRIAVVLAGGLVNIIFGLGVYIILVSSLGGYTSNKVTEITPTYAAEEVGIQIGDKILKVNGKKVRLSTDTKKYINETNGEKSQITIKRNEQIIELEIVPTEVISKNTGIYFGLAGEDLTTEIVAIYPGSPAEQKGLQIKDNIVKINGEDVNNDPYKVVELIDSSEIEEITFTVDRKGEQLDIKVIPEEISTYYLGVVFGEVTDTFLGNIYYGFWDTSDFALSIVDNLKMLFTGKVGVNQLTGPIGISEMVADTNTFADFIYLLALISLSLGVTNLLPFPPLDGGKIVILLVEWVRRKPLKENIEVGIQLIGFMVLIVLSIYVTYNDILRIF